MIKIDSCLIIKNEIENIENLIRQLEKFSNKICIAETGSTDGTKEWLEEEASRNPKLVLGYYEWTMDFSAARNYSWSLSTDADYRFWCDGDDLLTDALIDELVELSNKELTDTLADIIFIRYQYNPTLDLFRERLIRTRCTEISWHGFIHEYLNFGNNRTSLTLDGKEKYIVHHHIKDPGDKMRNFNHFNANVLPGNREVFYFGRECNILGMPMLGALLFIEALKKNDDWECNLISALCDLKQIQETYDYDFTDKWYNFVENLYNKCAKKGFKRCDLSFLMGFYHLYIKNDPDKAIQFYEESYNISEVDLNVNDFLIVRHLGTIGAPLDLCLIYANNKNDFIKAKEWNDKALKNNPNSETILSNDKILTKKINELKNSSVTYNKKENIEDIDCPDI